MFPQAFVLGALAGWLAGRTGRELAKNSVKAAVVTKRSLVKMAQKTYETLSDVAAEAMDELEQESVEAARSSAAHTATKTVAETRTVVQEASAAPAAAGAPGKTETT